jgi:hypothetical protein
MKTFTIESETNTITAHLTVREAKTVAGAERFATAAALAGAAQYYANDCEVCTMTSQRHFV